MQHLSAHSLDFHIESSLADPHASGLYLSSDRPPLFFSRIATLILQKNPLPRFLQILETKEEELDVYSPILGAENATKVEISVFQVCSLPLPKG